MLLLMSICLKSLTGEDKRVVMSKGKEALIVLDAVEPSLYISTSKDLVCGS